MVPKLFKSCLFGFVFCCFFIGEMFCLIGRLLTATSSTTFKESSFTISATTFAAISFNGAILAIGLILNSSSS